MSRFHISQRQAADYRRGDVFLAGDASHIHSPVGGQGMNTGIQDACNLAWKLALVASGRGRPELLDSYQAERHPVGEKLLAATTGFTRVVLWRNPVAEAVRDRAASILTAFDAVQDRIRMAGSELGIHYRGSPIVREDHAASLGGMWEGWLHRGLRAGDRAPDGTALAGGRPGAGASVRAVRRGAPHAVTVRRRAAGRRRRPRGGGASGGIPVRRTDRLSHRRPGFGRRRPPESCWTPTGRCIGPTASKMRRCSWCGRTVTSATWPGPRMPRSCATTCGGFSFSLLIRFPIGFSASGRLADVWVRRRICSPKSGTTEPLPREAS